MSSAGSRRKRGKEVIRKESAETQDYVSCQDVEVDNDKCVEEVSFVPNAVGNKCNEKGLAHN